MRESRIILLLLALIMVAVAGLGCDGDDPPNGPDEVNTINLTPVSFPTLKSELVYEGWMVKIDDDSNWVEWLSFGKFFFEEFDYFFLDPNDTTKRIDSIFTIDANVYDWDAIAITLETHPIDNNPDPSPTVVAFSVIDPEQFTIMQFPVSFEEASGLYVIGTFSDGRYDRVGDEIDNEFAGIWFMEYVYDPDTQLETYASGLKLPTLPDTGYNYEGWVALASGDTLSTGKFFFPDFQDYDNSFAAPGGIPNVPGEDFLQNAPPGLDFPLDLLQGGETFITVEPNPDNDLSRPSNLVVLRRNLPVVSSSVRNNSNQMANIAEATFPVIEVRFTKSN